MRLPTAARAFALALLALLGRAERALAAVTVAEPESPVSPAFPVGAPHIEAQIVLQLVVDADGHVESAVVVGRAPADTGASFDAAALAAVKGVRFRPSTRDGQAFRSRVEYVVVFHPPPVIPSVSGTSAQAPAAAAGPSAASASLPTGGPSSTPAARVTTGSPPASPLDFEGERSLEVEVRSEGWASRRGIGDLRITRELIEASPRQQTSEMLSAAPGFFVDHEDAEGFGNDVYLRGFDLEHGSGIEMRLGSIPINSPVHVQGQGYADANFIIPEVVRSIHVLEGPYDPRQGDAAIVGSAYFDLGVPDRGQRIKASYGSWKQMRLLGVTAPREADEETFAAFSVRKTNGFGARRAAESGSANAQLRIRLGEDQNLRLVAMAYTSRATLPGVVRADDVSRGLIGEYDSYPYFTNGQGVQASRVILGAHFERANATGTRFEFAPWLMWSRFRGRENYTGNIYSSALDPALAGGQGDLWETSNGELAFGVTSRFHAAPLHVASWLEATTEPGVYVRAGHTDQSKSLLNPDTLSVWDRRLDAGVDTLDAGAYWDVDLRFFRRLRISGGVRADFLAVSVDDRLGYDVPARAATGEIPGANRATQGLVAGPRATLEYEVTPELTLGASYGEGFRSLGANASVATSNGIAGEGPTIQEGGRPYSKVRSAEVGARAQTRNERFSASIALFETRVRNELVFEATSGGFSTEGASLRRGFVASAVARPFEWLLASVATSVSSSTFTTLVPGVSHDVPNVPPVLLRADITARGELAQVSGAPLTGRAGVGYTFLAGRHLTDKVVGPSNNVLNASGALKYRAVEVSVEAYNVLGLHYADDAEYYVSNWSVRPGTPLATPAIHLTPAPPFTLIGSVGVSF